MATAEWRRIPTVLLPQEIIDKSFRRASKMSGLVDDPDKYHRVRKQMNRMVQSSSDTIVTTLLDWVDRWPSLNSLSEFDQALIDASVGADEYRKNLGGNGDTQIVYRRSRPISDGHRRHIGDV